MMIVFFTVAFAAQAVPPGEEPVEPYTQSDANAGATPFRGAGMLRAFHGRTGINRMTDDFVDRLLADKRITDIFKSQDIVRLRRLLKEQFCYILNGGCAYTGRTMKASHNNLGIQEADMGALVEDLQAAMRKEKIGFFEQNRFLAKLAPIKREAVQR
ncbi:group I truncated hemoglobin [Sphingomonas immobilis]|uniref:Group 1 truncated hemoglobin n=1 Tax=Sphingomonas immobilis TaxID=3063997 RepID=A0ABT8ZWG8_9SPHN|nr:group 1 truncated hemoglobin [Sphingomonas sp. CA1-15]MDO7841903.1 group 1 truncated hemoglobin [Sphingomonas sp. CA1-15]